MEDNPPTGAAHHPPRSRPRRRCGECSACRREDCGECRNCLRFTKFGGDGSCKNVCVHRRCRNLQPPTSSRAASSSTPSPSRRMGSEGEDGEGRGYGESDSSKSAAGQGEASSDGGSEQEEEETQPPELPGTRAKPRIKLLLKRRLAPEKTAVMDADPAPSPRDSGIEAAATVDSPPPPPPEATLEEDAEEDARPHLYGRPVPRHCGRCAGCLGSRDADALHEAILLCDGRGCSREYHLGCVDPPLTKVPEDEFYCFDCDPNGTTGHLRSYFEDAEEDRAEYGSSREFVEYLLRVQMAEEGASGEGKKKAQKREGESCGADAAEKIGGKGAEVGKKRKRSFSGAIYGSMEEGGDDNGSGTFKAPSSELSIITALHYAAMKETVPLENEVETKEQTEELGPEFLVGKLVRLYCPADNNYHTGRIVDWRSASNVHLKGIAKERGEKQLMERADFFHGKGSIASSEFLVRFAPGIEGRKKLLLRWLILEEHSLAVSSTVIWGQLRKGRGLSGWRPAQTLIRTSLELVPVRHLLETGGSSEHFSLALFFGEESHVYLRLRDEAMDFFSPTFGSRLEGNALGPSSAGGRGGASAAPPSGGAQPDVSVSLALLEIEEQKRVFAWHKLPLQNPAHQRALSANDEFALPPLLFPPLKDDKQEKNSNGGNKICTDLDGGGDDDSAQPQLCPLIERGLDRRWLAHLMGGNKAEKSIDALESICIQKCLSSRLALSILNERKGVPDIR